MKQILAQFLAVVVAASPCILGAQQTPSSPRMSASPVSTDQGAYAYPSPGEVQPLNNLIGISPEYRIGPSDLIEIEVFGVPDLKRLVRVNASGNVSLNLVGNLKIAGMTAQEAEETIAKAYGEKYLQDPQVSLFIREFTTQRITVEGAVAKPGIYPVTGQITLLRALALAGGGVKYADTSQVVVFRGDKSQQVFDLDAIRKGERPDPVIQAEDIVVVNRSAARTALRDSLFRDIVDSINPFSGLTGGGN